MGRSRDLSGGSYVATDFALASSNLPAGTVLQVLQTVKTDTFSSTSSSWTDITGLSVSITPSSTSSKILVMYSLMTGMQTSQFPLIRIARNSTGIAIGDAYASSSQVTTSAWPSGAVNATDIQSMQFLDSPSSTSAITYSMQTRSDASQTFYLNRNTRDNGNSYEPRSVSSITAMEIAG
jgi:hypothetical protein